MGTTPLDLFPFDETILDESSSSAAAIAAEQVQLFGSLQVVLRTLQEVMEEVLAQHDGGGTLEGQVCHWHERRLSSKGRRDGGTLPA